MKNYCIKCVSMRQALSSETIVNKGIKDNLGIYLRLFNDLRLRIYSMVQILNQTLKVMSPRYLFGRHFIIWLKFHFLRKLFISINQLYSLRGTYLKYTFLFRSIFKHIIILKTSKNPTAVGILVLYYCNSF